jgi:hypothetical protein
MPLSETLRNQAGFVTINGAIRLLFEFKHPFAVHYMLTMRRSNETPDIIEAKGSIFVIHGSFLGRNNKCIHM